MRNGRHLLDGAAAGPGHALLVAQAAHVQKHTAPYNMLPIVLRLRLLRVIVWRSAPVRVQRGLGDQAVDGGQAEEAGEQQQQTWGKGGVLACSTPVANHTSRAGWGAEASAAHR